jgi:hypothetical protein
LHLKVKGDNNTKFFEKNTSPEGVWRFLAKARRATISGCKRSLETFANQTARHRQGVPRHVLDGIT